jgi:glycosyltransferase involved in cell wall biosynthesis
MQVGFLIYGSLQSTSGGYLYDRKVCEYLRANADQVNLFRMVQRSYSKHLTDNFSCHWLNTLARARLDVLLQDELNHPSLFLLNRRLRLRVSYPIVSIVHHLRSKEKWPLPAGLFYRTVEKLYLASVDGFIYNSQATCRSVEKLLGGHRRGLIAFPGGDRLGGALAERNIVRRLQRGGPLRLLFVGNVIARKGLHGLLEGLAALRHHSWELWIVGSLKTDANYVSTIRRSISRLALAEKVRLLDAVSDPELATLLQRGDVIAMPFSYEGFGIVYLEGMAYGLPALASSCGGAREIVIHGENGYLFEPGDVQGLIRVLRRLIDDRDQLERLSLAARKRFFAFPTWEQTTARIRDFLVDLIYP